MRRDRLLIFTVIAVLGLDQFTKYLVRTTFSPGESWPTDGWVRITYGLNSGTAFGLFANQTVVLIVASVVAIGFLYYFYRTQAQPKVLLRFAIGLQLGGAFGNLLDRIVNGVVVDFIDVGPWPIFNLADSSIVVGIAILLGVILLLDGRASRESRPVAERLAEDADEGASRLT